MNKPTEAGSIGAVIVAAGRSSRMDGIDKMWLDLDGRPLLAYSIAALAKNQEIRRLVLVLSVAGRHMFEERRTEEPWTAVSLVVEGGATRADSVYRGLQELAGIEIVLVHDGARPLASQRLILAGIEAARRGGAAVPALPIVDTVKRIDSDGTIVETLDRSMLCTVQTPQVFRHDLLREAYERIGEERASCTDDAALLERLGVPVTTFSGDPHNIKVTRPADIPLASLYLRERTGG